MDRLGKLEVLNATGRELGPGRHTELTGKISHEVAEVGTLHVSEGLALLGDVLRHLLDDDVLFFLAELGDLALHGLVLLHDIFTADLVVDGLGEGVEGDGCFRAHVTETQRVERHIVRGVSYTGLAQRVAESFPGTTRRRHLAGIHVLGRVQPLLVGREEVHHRGMDLAALASPGEPVLGRRCEVDGPETVQESWVHLVDSVGRRVVDGREDASLWVKLPAIELAVEDDLEGCLHHLGSGSIELVQKEAHRLVTGTLVPLRGVESSDLAVRGRKAYHVTLGHLREPAINHLVVSEAFHLSDRGSHLPHHLTLADAVWPSEED